MCFPARLSFDLATMLCCGLCHDAVLDVLMDKKFKNMRSDVQARSVVIYSQFMRHTSCSVAKVPCSLIFISVLPVHHPLTMPAVE